ncbi:MAG TPA: prevent-host-death protein [Firmicutes bacterium]|nr:prevent-host-death protein [Bacillota bacterium]
MIVDSSELKNNLQKYLRLTGREEIIITHNGTKTAKLSAYDDTLPAVGNGSVKEEAKLYFDSPRKVSYEEFQALSESSEERYEYIDGEIYLLASPKAIHQKILSELHGVFHNWFAGKKCRPFFAPFDITLKRSPENINVVQPDLMVICDFEENINEKGYYMGVPALVVEVISESTRSKDFVRKLDLYMSTGVQEYWIINPLNGEVSVYRFEDGNIQQNTTYKDKETARSICFPGLEVNLEQFFG